MGFKLSNQSNLGKKVGIVKRFNDKIAYNFSYLSKDKDYILDKSDKKEKIKLLERMLYFSNMDKIEATGLDKRKGFELIEESECKAHIDSEFKKSGRDDECENKLYIFRLGRDARVIGKFNDNILYILFIDKHLKAYDHGS